MDISFDLNRTFGQILEMDDAKLGRVIKACCTTARRMFDGSTELSITEYIREAADVSRMVKDSEVVYHRAAEEKPSKRRGRPPKIKKDVYTLAREKTARRNA